MNPQSNPPPALTPETSYRPRVPGGIEDRLDEVLGHEGNPYESNYEAMVEGVQAAKALAKKCKQCKGSGIREFSQSDYDARQKRLDRFDDEIARTESDHHRAKLQRAKHETMSEEFVDDDWCRRCNGTGWLYAPSSKPLGLGMWCTDRCNTCKGCGEMFDLDDMDASLDREDVCPRCSRRNPWTQMGYYEACSARPKPPAMGGGWSGASATDNPLDALPPIVARHSRLEPETALEYGRVQRAIREVRDENAVLAAAIETYHGPAADRWKLHPWGRRFALWVHTEAGQKLVTESHARLGARFLPVDVIASERQAEETSKITPELASLEAQRKRVRRRALIRDADRQARMLEALMQDRIRRIEL